MSVPPPERSTPFFELWDALAEPDCPICVLARRRARQFMENFFYEHVNDAALRSRLRESLGFSPEALQMAAEIHDALGTSILYAALSADVTRRLRGEVADSLSPAGACPLAETVRSTEANYVDTFARHYRAADLQARHAESFGLCLGHLAQVLAALSDKSLRERLRCAEAVKYARLGEELDLFEAKNDYRNHEPFGAEVDAWQRAARKFRRPECPGRPA